MLKTILLVVVVLLVVAVAGVLWMMKGPDLSKYEALKDPRITHKPDVWVLEVPFEVPAEKLSQTFGVLFKTYFKLKGVPKGPDMPAPVARYANALDPNLSFEARMEAFKKAVWKGVVAIPVPETVTSLPAPQNGAEPAPSLAKWPYGDVAEILHHGSYDTETPAIQRLVQYIKDQGYEIAGEHEEEYLRGPGMFSKPENYVTIIRYQVKKKQ